MLGCLTDSHIFKEILVIGANYSNKILLPYESLFRGSVGPQILFNGRQCVLSSHNSSQRAFGGGVGVKADYLKKDLGL